MSDRSSNIGRPLKPTLASTRAARTPLTPRIAAGATPSTISTRSKKPSTARSETPKLTLRLKQEETPCSGALPLGNVTPRSSARKTRVDSSQSTPTSTDDTPSLPRPRSNLAFTTANVERHGGGSSGGFNGARASRPKSLVSDSGSNRGRSPPLVRSPGRFDLEHATQNRSIDGRFFHASDVPKPEPPPKKIEPRKGPTFVYANGQQEGRRSNLSSRATSPVLSAVSEQRSSGPWIRPDSVSNPSKSPPLLSPALSTLSNTSPFFAAATGQRKPRSPSPSKENIHLSYRKGASQIFGTRPAPRQTDTGGTVSVLSGERRGSLANAPGTPHRKSPSLSSIDSGNSQQSRRRSATTLDAAPTSSPLTQEVKSATVPRLAKAPPSIDTSLDPQSNTPAPQSAFSPTKSYASISDLAADARRERKVLDLEISNSSLLAINASLEREVRRQKAELKRFRRLSRARRSLVGVERSARLSDALSAVGEEGDGGGEGEDDEFSAFGPPSGFTDLYDEESEEDDDEIESIPSGGEPLSPSARSSREDDRLAKDEKRLRVDLERHKELLVQSQMMNQSLKRCMYTTEEMIREGKKALVCRVRVSDVKLGGRILTGHEDEEEEEEEGREGEEVEVEVEVEVEGEDETLRGEDGGDEAEEFLKVWQGVGKLPFEGSEGGDSRDSGIEVDRPLVGERGGGGAEAIAGAADCGRPPDGGDGDSGGA